VIDFIEPDTEQDIALASQIHVQAVADHGPLDAYKSTTPSIIWLIRSDGEVIGLAGAHSWDYPSRRCRGMIFIKAELRGKGLGKLAITALNKMLFDRYNVRKIEGCCDASNLVMVRLMEGIGGKIEGTWHDAGYCDGRYVTYAQYYFMKEDA
jgi:RimJ/RimL family protein N-acetyltransferase